MAPASKRGGFRGREGKKAPPKKRAHADEEERVLSETTNAAADEDGHEPTNKKAKRDSDVTAPSELLRDDEGDAYVAVSCERLCESMRLTQRYS